MPTIVIRHPNGTTEERDVTGKLTVGCDDGNDLVLRAGGVSQRHAQFFADGGELVLENVGSAAATLVDGESIGHPTKLRAGVKVLIGEYEVTLKPDQAQMLVRKVGAPTAENTVSDDAGPVATPASRTSWPIGLGAGVLVALVVAAAIALKRPPPPTVEEVPIVPPKADPLDPCSNLEQMLRPAREAPSEKALAAANAVLECDPLNVEAGQLKRDIEAELKAALSAERGMHLVELGREAEGLAAFKEISPRALTFVGIQLQALAVAARVEKAAAEACRTYSRQSRWVQAAAACEQAMNLRCQSMTHDELTPPIGKTAGWKPSEPLLAMLLKAREKVDPRGPAWTCAPVAILRPRMPEPTKTDAAPAPVRQSADPQINAALALYAKGNLNEAIVQLQVVKEKSEKAAVHAEAEKLRTDMVTVDSLQKIGQREFETGELEKGARNFREALDADARLTLGPGASPAELERKPSALRRTIVATAAEQALRVGRPFSEHGDLKKACAAWRIGFAFYRGNTELNDDLNHCSSAAKALLDGAQSCAELAKALELAVPGDLLAEAIAARKTELNCR